jgi:hypothetical protein
MIKHEVVSQEAVDSLVIFYSVTSKYRSFATTVSQLKISDFSGETFKGFEVLYFSMSARTTQLLSSGWFYKLHYDTIPIKSASANISLYTNN